MKIMWMYLDTRRGAEKAILDREKMQKIIDDTDENIKKENDNVTSLRSPSMDGMPHAHNLHAMETRILNSMERVKKMSDRYAMAKEYMEWFMKAWDAQTEDDRYVLSQFYETEDDYGNGAADTVADYYGISIASAYRKKKRALSNLGLSLFGKHD